MGRRLASVRAGLDVNACWSQRPTRRSRPRVAGAEIGDFADPVSARDAFEHVGFLVSIENRLSDISACADVVFPAALSRSSQARSTTGSTASSGRPGQQDTALAHDRHRVLAALADAMGSDLGVRSIAQAACRARRAQRVGRRSRRGAGVPGRRRRNHADGFRLATWRELIDDFPSQRRRRRAARDRQAASCALSASTAAQAGVTAGGTVAVGTARGELTYDAVIDDTVVDGVVWIPSRAAGETSRRRSAHVPAIR